MPAFEKVQEPTSVTCRRRRRSWIATGLGFSESRRLCTHGQHHASPVPKQASFLADGSLPPELNCKIGTEVGMFDPRMVRLRRLHQGGSQKGDGISAKTGGHLTSSRTVLRRRNGIFAAGDWRAKRGLKTMSPRRDRKSETTTREKWPQKRLFC